MSLENEQGRGRAVGVLVPMPAGPLAHPSQRPLGRAALRLEAEGTPVVFGDRIEDGRMGGSRATPAGWVPVEGVEVVGVHDRFPSQKQAAAYARIRAAMGAVPLANPTWLTLLCRDKLRCQRTLEGAGLVAPEVEEDPRRFHERLSEWGAAYLKPRYGAFGRGVRRVVPGDELPARGEGAQPGVIEDLILQRAVPPLPGWAGVAVRVNAQRLPDGSWHLNPGVARRSRHDPVVNASRGAEVAVADDVLAPSTRVALYTLTEAVCEALSARPGGEWVVELGVDAVIDRHGRPQLVEVNSRPRGRLEVLAAQWGARFEEQHLEACARPLRYLLARG